MEEFIIGNKIVHKYKESGQRKVYKIKNDTYGECILKMGRCMSSNAMERMKRETEILRSLDSKSFPKNYDFKYDLNGNFIILEEYINSESLSDIIKEFEGDEKKSFKFLLDIVDGLNELWKKRIVHRDLKPDNILVREDMKPVIIDLGIARALDEKSLTLTIQQNGPCTPIYASPEQWGNDKEHIDIRSDFYSLAIIVSEMILGKNPFSPEVVDEGISILENLTNNKFKLSYKDIEISEKGKKFIEKLLNRQPYNRIRSYKILRERIIELI